MMVSRSETARPLLTWGEIQQLPEPSGFDDTYCDLDQWARIMANAAVRNAAVAGMAWRSRHISR